MSVTPKMVLLTVACISMVGCGGQNNDGSDGIPAGAPPGESTIDLRSYRLGSIGAFAEMVGAGVKRLALSAPMTPVEMDALFLEAQRIAGENGAGIYLETDFLVTDLFPSDLTEGKQVLLICHEGTYQEYLALKARKLDLVVSGDYVGEARKEIARRFGGLLSYSQEKIDDLLRSTHGGS